MFKMAKTGDLCRVMEVGFVCVQHIGGVGGRVGEQRLKVRNSVR